MTTKDLRDHLKTTHSQLEVYRPCFFRKKNIFINLLILFIEPKQYNNTISDVLHKTFVKDSTSLCSDYYWTLYYIKYNL